MAKKNIKKKKFCKPYIFYGILIFLGIVLIFFFIYGVTSSKSKISGRVVLEDYIDEASCVVEGYTWENLTEQNCTTITTCIDEPIEYCWCLEYEDINGTQGDCINWSSCINETCSDEENCNVIIIGGQCTGDLYDKENTQVEQDITDITGDVIEESTDTLTDEEIKILAEKFGEVSVKITEAELVEGRIVIRYELGDYWFEPSYDNDLSKKDLELQMEFERIKWLKDIADTLLQKEINSEKIADFIGNYPI